MKIFVGNLAFSVDENELRDLFEQYGVVDNAQVIMDRESGRSRGFGFVEMPEEEDAKSAIKNLQGVDMSGRAINVNEAQPKKDTRGGYGDRERRRY